MIGGPAGTALQEASRLRPNTLTANNKIICTRRRFFQPTQQSTSASVAAGNSGRELRWRAAVVVADVVTLSVVEAAPPEGVTVAGEKAHDAPEGSPEQLNETAELKPFSGVTETPVVPLCPAVKVSDAGVAATEKSGAAAVPVTTWLRGADSLDPT